MKQVTLTVRISATVPDDAPLGDLCVDVLPEAIAVVDTSSDRVWADSIDCHETVAAEHENEDEDEAIARLTKEQVTAYLEKRGNLCPYCESEQIEGQSIEVNDGFATQEVICLNCSAVWMDEYRLVAVTPSTMPETNEG
ncbi:MAG: hypothetical protein KY475_13045 [Planctomycetes bacterium]|nr:hypothetical protein [Planctomycetota bacterium]